MATLVAILGFRLNILGMVNITMIFQVKLLTYMEDSLGLITKCLTNQNADLNAAYGGLVLIRRIAGIMRLTAIKLTVKPN